MPNAADFEHLPVAEKVQLVTQLWDQIAKSNEPLILPDAVVVEAERRLDELNDNPALGISEDEMWRRVDEKRK